MTSMYHCNFEDFNVTHSGSIPNMIACRVTRGYDGIDNRDDILPFAQSTILSTNLHTPWNNVNVYNYLQEVKYNLFEDIINSAIVYWCPISPTVLIDSIDITWNHNTFYNCACAFDLFDDRQSFWSEILNFISIFKAYTLVKNSAFYNVGLICKQNFIAIKISYSVFRGGVIGAYVDGGNNIYADPVFTEPQPDLTLLLNGKEVDDDIPVTLFSSPGVESSDDDTDMGCYQFYGERIVDLMFKSLLLESPPGTKFELRALHGSTVDGISTFSTFSFEEADVFHLNYSADNYAHEQNRVYQALKYLRKSKTPIEWWPFYRDGSNLANQQGRLSALYSPFGANYFSSVVFALSKAYFYVNSDVSTVSSNNLFTGKPIRIDLTTEAEVGFTSNDPFRYVHKDQDGNWLFNINIKSNLTFPIKYADIDCSLFEDTYMLIRNNSDIDDDAQTNTTGRTNPIDYFYVVNCKDYNYDKKTENVFNSALVCKPLHLNGIELGDSYNATGETRAIWFFRAFWLGEISIIEFGEEYLTIGLPNDHNHVPFEFHDFVITLPYTKDCERFVNLSQEEIFAFNRVTSWDMDDNGNNNVESMSCRFHLVGMNKYSDSKKHILYKAYPIDPRNPFNLAKLDLVKLNKYMPKAGWMAAIWSMIIDVERDTISVNHQDYGNKDIWFDHGTSWHNYRDHQKYKRSPHGFGGMELNVIKRKPHRAIKQFEVI